jgi:hypothetical protein
MNQLSDGAAKLCTGLFGYAAVWDKLNQFTHWLNDLQFFDCDGVVAADAVSVSADTLETWTRNGAMHRETRRYPGSNSPVGCGENPPLLRDLVGGPALAPGGGAPRAIRYVAAAAERWVPVCREPGMRTVPTRPDGGRAGSPLMIPVGRRRAPPP